MRKLDTVEKVMVGLVVATIGSLIAVYIRQSSIDPEEAAAAAQKELFEDIIFVRPREGVECYVLNGWSSTRPRTMSCVVLPATAEDTRDF